MKEVIVLDTVWNRKLIGEHRWHGKLKGVDRQGNTVEYDCEATICEY
ncbi:hypothetical protein [Pediococcus acidilactici]